MIFKTVVPILYSRDISTSLAYYTDILGFTGKWAWGDPPTFGGIVKDSVEVFFCKECQGNPGTWLSIMVDKVDEYFESVKSKGAKTGQPPQTMEWGVREFIVEDPDGHILRFGQNMASSNHEHHEPLPDIRIVEKKATNPAIAYSIAAEDPATGQSVGSAHLLCFDNDFFYVKDVFVQPEWRGRGIATQLMKALTAWIDANAPGKASIWLHTAENLAPFYKQFGFLPVTGMARFLP